ncbi:MAG: hypothetical protein COV59_04430 [Candidatus Magasanikbacteria bacterium CG11_big_fil_rev_8_21_14_0_20_39_34]|uniref:Glycosyl transferase family 1 n=1 Tax=Candidatus Magasanikbacteria bacterium CG11_big_fil_rev_8_21_14_0_20_39_34 TaxID=1974653 RepID=A0A2H0N4R7_9BACT|nr:MAG: hypothetical protein COV59_04430 [Candidatus Magasanikbacteria bacterium CG11_big_fil_rev_8_21_14_0_20_39_34]
MKIAMIGQKGIPAFYGGIERHVQDLSEHLVCSGHDVTVYSRKWYSKSAQKEHKSIKIAYAPTVKTKHLDAITHTFFATLHAIRQNYDIIHYHGVGPSLLSWIPRLFTPKVKVVTTFHCIDRYHQKWNIFARLMLRAGEWAACHFAHKTITVSESLRQYCLNEFHTETEYIPNGVNINNKVPSEKYLKRFGLEKGKYLVMISRLVGHKGAHLLIESFVNLKRKNKDNKEIQEMKLAIVGGHVFTNDYVTQLHQMASQENDIIFTDFQSGNTLESLYAHTHVLVHPSLNEGLPLTVLQAMGYGKPVLLSNIPEHLELTQDGRAIFTQNDTKALEKKLYEFISLPEKEKEMLGVINKKTVQTSYTWENIAQQTGKLYKDLLQSNVQKEFIMSTNLKG